MSDADAAARDAEQPLVSRRAVLRGVALAAAAGAAVPLVTGCGAGESTAASGGAGAGSGGVGSGGGSHANVLGPASAVPVGGGVIYGEQVVVVTQPTKGVFRGFSAICTHAGCPLADVQGGTINCVCHGSRFSIQNGNVIRGPATKPLPTRKVSVKGNQLTLG
jgi:nitrite reductase/ring-hydroxylating ferredoxin subunit